MKSTPIFEMYAATPLLYRPRFSSGVNQYGLKPETAYDFVNPTQLVNFGAGTTVDTLDVRRAPSGLKSSPSFNSVPITDNYARALGLITNDPNAISFCSKESAALRICMARGSPSCEQENSRLEQCLGRVRPLRSALWRMGQDFTDWFIQDVSDNFTKPFKHRPQDHKSHYMTEMHDMRRRMWGKGGSQFPKPIQWGKVSFRQHGHARYSRLPVNK